MGGVISTGLQKPRKVGTKKYTSQRTTRVDNSSHDDHVTLSSDHVTLSNDHVTHVTLSSDDKMTSDTHHDIVTPCDSLMLSTSGSNASPLHHSSNNNEVCSHFICLFVSSF